MSTSVKHRRDKGKKRATHETQPTDPGGKNEGVDPTWAFQPPPGTHLIKNDDVDNGDFDWDTINDDEDLELWLLRVPENVQPKHLEGLSFGSSLHLEGKKKTTHIGTFKRKHATFDIWSLGDGTTAEGPIVGGDEIKSLSCLLPRKSKKGRMYPAPRPIERHIIFSAQPPQPTAPDPSPSSGLSSQKDHHNLINPSRFRYPPELLKHRFMPYGSLVDTTTNPPASQKSGQDTKYENGREDADVDMDADMAVAEMEHDIPLSLQPSTQPDTIVTGKSKSKKNRTGENEAEETITKEEKVKQKSKKNKKRKGEDSEVTDPPKKLKKAKTVR